MKKKIAILGVAIMSLSMLAGCSGYSTRLADYSDYITLGSYTGLEYTPMSTDVTDEDVQYELDSFVEGLAEEVEVTDRAVKMGDSINIDYVGSVDGVEFDGGSTKGEGTDIVVGESGYIDDFDEQLVGAKIGETINVEVTFPVPYENNEELAGKDAVFVTTINSITETVTPELTDALVAENTEYKTIAEYKEALRLDLIAEAEASAEEDKISQLIAAAADNCKFSAYPEDEVKALVDETITEIQSNASMYGLDYATYIYYFYGCETEADFDAYLADSAQVFIEEKMAVCEIAKREKIEISDEDIAAYVAELVEEYGLAGADDVYEYYTDEDLEYMLLVERVGELLSASAVAVEDTTEDDTTAEQG